MDKPAGSVGHWKLPELWVPERCHPGSVLEQALSPRQLTNKFQFLSGARNTNSHGTCNIPSCGSVFRIASVYKGPFWSWFGKLAPGFRIPIDQQEVLESNQSDLDSSRARLVLRTNDIEPTVLR